MFMVLSGVRDSTSSCPSFVWNWVHMTIDTVEKIPKSPWPRLLTCLSRHTHLWSWTKSTRQSGEKPRFSLAGPVPLVFRLEQSPDKLATVVTLLPGHVRPARDHLSNIFRQIYHLGGLSILFLPGSAAVRISCTLMYHNISSIFIVLPS